VTEVVFTEQQPVEGAERRVRPGATVGRAGADIVLSDPEVSRRHAIFHQSESGIGIADLDSRNGTFVNEQRIKGVTSLAAGDLVRFGNTVWRLGETPPHDPDRMPSALRRVVPTAAFYGELPSFEATPIPSPVLGFSAARVLSATIFCYLVILLTAAAVTLFFVTR